MRPGFMIYHANMRALVQMSDRDLGLLMKLLYRVSIGEAAQPPTRLRVVFDMMAERIREDAEHYEEKVEKARRAGKASADKRTSTDVNKRQRTLTDVNQSNPIQSNLIQSNPNNNVLNYAQRTDDMKDVLIDL